MKKCILMFLFFILALFLAVWTDSIDNTIVDERMVVKEITNENQITNGVILEEVQKN